MNIKSSEIISYGEWKIKASQNDKDGYVLLVITCDIIEYSCIHSFHDSESAMRWVKDLEHKIGSVREYFRF